MSRVVVGRLKGVFGVRGELKCVPTSLGEGAIEPGREFALAAEGDTRRLLCVAARGHQARLVVAFEGVTTVEQAQALVGSALYAERDDIEFGPGEYFDSDLIGLQLRDEDGRELGQVVGVEHFPAQDCLVIGPGRALVPLVRAFVRGIDLERRTIVMSLPEGLLE